jgi:hypothetical protein
MHTPCVLPHTGVERVYRTDYDTLDNMDSPAYTLPDV